MRKGNKVVHSDDREIYICDECNDDSTPIEGTRFTCLTCGDYDLCQRHYSRRHIFHDRSHEWLEVRVHGKVGKLVQSTKKKHSENVCDYDDIDPNLRGRLKIKLHERMSTFEFPLDCFGLILEHTTSPSDFLNYLLTCKHLNQYIIFKHPKSTRHVKFDLFRVPSKSVSFCSRLEIDRQKLVNGEEFSNFNFLKFPNLTHLSIQGVKDFKISTCLITSDGFQYLPKNLTSLKIDNIPCIRDEHFKHLPNLRKLSIRYEQYRILPLGYLKRIESGEGFTSEIVRKRFGNRYSPNGTFLKYLPNLEVLKLMDIESIKGEIAGQYISKKLRKLVLWNLKKLEIGIMDHLSELEHLELYRCKRLLGFLGVYIRGIDHEKERLALIQKQFSKLSKVKFLSIRWCDGIESKSDEEFIKNKCLPKEVRDKVEFEFKAITGLPGRARYQPDYQ